MKTGQMEIFVKAKTKAKQNLLEKIDDNHFFAAVTQAPVKGKANQAIVRLMAQYLKIAPSRIEIISGHQKKQKVLKIF